MIKPLPAMNLPLPKMKPANKQALANEIKRAMDAHGNEVDLNYIDTLGHHRHELPF